MCGLCGAQTGRNGLSEGAIVIQNVGLGPCAIFVLAMCREGVWDALTVAPALSLRSSCRDN